MSKGAALIISVLVGIYISFTVYYAGTLDYFFRDRIVISYILLLASVSALSFCILYRFTKNSVLSPYKKVHFIFALCILTCLTGSILGIDLVKTFSEEENRLLAKFPKRFFFHEKFPREYDSFIDDRIAFRKNAQNLFSAISYYTFEDINLKNKELIGKNGWIFPNGQEDTAINFQKTSFITENELSTLVKQINIAKKLCDEKNIPLYFIIVPNKSTIYPEYYPDFIKRADNPEPYEVISEAIMNNSNINFVNIYNDFQNKKKEKQIYFKDDTHWNSSGAYTAYKKLSEAILKDFPGFKYVEDERVFSCNKEKEHLINNYKKGDLIRSLKFKNIPPDLSNGICIKNPVNVTKTEEEIIHFHSLQRFKTSYTEGLRIMIFHDSFTFAMRPFLYEGASDIITVWATNRLPKISSPAAYEELIDKFKPDIIIWEMVEHYTRYIMKGYMSYEKYANKK